MGAMDAVLRAIDRFNEYKDLLDDARDVMLPMTRKNDANTQYAMRTIIFSFLQAKKVTLHVSWMSH